MRDFVVRRVRRSPYGSTWWCEGFALLGERRRVVDKDGLLLKLVSKLAFADARDLETSASCACWSSLITLLGGGLV